MDNIVIYVVVVVVCFIVCFLLVFACLSCSNRRVRKKLFGKRKVKRSFNVRPLPSLPGEPENLPNGKDSSRNGSMGSSTLLGSNGLFRTLSKKRYASKTRKGRSTSTLGSKGRVVRRTERRKTTKDTVKNKELNYKHNSRKTKRLKRNEAPSKKEKISNDKEEKSNGPRRLETDPQRSDSVRIACESPPPDVITKETSGGMIQRCRSFSGAPGKVEDNVMVSQSAPYLTILDEPIIIPNVSSTPYDVAETAYDHNIFRIDGSKSRVVSPAPMPRGASLWADRKAVGGRGAMRK